MPKWSGRKIDLHGIAVSPWVLDVNIQQFLHYSHLFIEFLIKGAKPLVAGSCEAILTAQVLHAIDDTLIKT